MKLAIMQPYLFPYLGYFQLIHAVDTFVFYDDVHFIKRGWINRNRLIFNKEPHYFTVPLQKASQNKRINEVEVALTDAWLKTFFKTLTQNYSKAPYFKETYELVERVFSSGHQTISGLAMESIIQVCLYLGIDTQFEVSSQTYGNTINYEKADRLIAITAQKGYRDYVNPAGGKDLYDPPYFKSKGIQLLFIDHELVPYTQFGNEFVNGLSIIDVLMFNTPEETKKLMSQYSLE
tara:strand:+ start:2547 stop:3248 length:702 start_codon:yes stop_codon:yes gene_type:complete